MAAYIIADLVVNDAETYSAYAAQTPDIIAKYGGKFIVRGGTAEIIEGDWSFNRVIVVEFPDMASLRKFWDSPDYQNIIAIRQASTDSRLMIVDGV